jgi:hypothetical protein
MYIVSAVLVPLVCPNEGLSGIPNAGCVKFSLANQVLPCATKRKRADEVDNMYGIQTDDNWPTLTAFADD